MRQAGRMEVGWKLRIDWKSMQTAGQMPKKQNNLRGEKNGAGDRQRANGLKAGRDRYKTDSYLYHGIWGCLML